MDFLGFFEPGICWNFLTIHVVVYGEHFHPRWGLTDFPRENQAAIQITKELVSRFASSTGDPLILLDLIAEDDAQKKKQRSNGAYLKGYWYW